MKQNITKTQFNELTEKAKIKLRKWWWKDSINESYFGDPDEGLYQLSIGQMIEFLGNRNWPFLEIHQGKKLHEGLEVDNWSVETVNPDEEYQSEELCDALWEAVKEV